MKFDFVIGNPPYQEEKVGTSDAPVYDKFMDAAYTVSDKVELITPARFLFNAGKTPKPWNNKMLHDRHLKVIAYEEDAKKIFTNTGFKGGVAVTYRDETQDFGPIGIYIEDPILNSILHKVIKHKDFKSLSQEVYAPESYKFTKVLYEEHPEIKSMTFLYKGKEGPLISKGHDYDITSNIFDKLDNIVFFKEKPSGSDEYIRVEGLSQKNRSVRWIKSAYIANHDNLYKYKMLFPKANGSGQFGEAITLPLIAEPGEGHTQTFISIGKCDTRVEAENEMKYVLTKFARALLGILKVTQDNKRGVWKYVPLQDFTSSSDIDWSKSVHEIDEQLYDKYGLTKEERDFIETHVKEME